MSAETFKNYCTCGGFAWQMNGRPKAQPHMDWCPQRDEYAEWYAKRNHPIRDGQEAATKGSNKCPLQFGLLTRRSLNAT